MMNKILSVVVLVFAFAKAYSQVPSPQTEVVDITHIGARITPDFASKSISGSLVVTFTMLQAADSVRLDAKHMKVIDETSLFKITATDTHIVFTGNFEAGGIYKARFNYSATPKQTLYFVNNKGSEQIWTQGQGKYTSHWLPSIDDMNDKIEFDFHIGAPAEYRIISNGKLIEKLTKGGVTNWKFNSESLISSYLAALVAGDYKVKKETSSSGIPLEYYYYPQDSLKVEPTYRYSKQIFDFLETEIGVPYPWQNYKQVPVKDFLYAGMENASLTIFSDSFMVDEVGFVDRNYVNVNAHELAHQWFGDLVTETKSEHHWLHEGFATYYALLAEREIFGDDYFYYKLYESAEQLRALSDQGKGQQLVAAGGSSLTYYQKGAWAIHILREKVGEDVFTEAVKNYLEKHTFKNVTTYDFMTEVAGLTSINLDDFGKNWLYQTAFQAEDALVSLTKSAFMRQYFELQSLRSLPLDSKKEQLRTALTLPNDYLGQEAVYQLAGEPLDEALLLYTLAFSSNNTFVRQAIASSLEQVPEALEDRFLTLLDDESYATQEQALLKIWFTYSQLSPEVGAGKQARILNTLENKFGFNDGNIRALWLALAIATPGYKENAKQTFYKELTGYTAPEQPFQLRETAFRYLFQIQLYDATSIKNLIEGCVHHNWRFRESARSILKELMSNERWKTEINRLKNTLPEKQNLFLSKL